MADICEIDGKPVFFLDDTPPEIGRLLARVELAQGLKARRALLLDAIEQHPQALDLRLALYKMLFRTGQYRQAEQAVWGALTASARQGGFTRNYRRLGPSSAPWLTDKGGARIYLFSLKALGVVRLRRGRVALADRVLTKLLELDPEDEIGGSNFLAIARSFREDAPAQRHGAGAP